MVLATTIQATLLRHSRAIDTALRTTLDAIATRSGRPELASYYGQMQYHLGWVDAEMKPVQSNAGKLLRPTLLLLAYEATRAWEPAHESPENALRAALPAAVTVELGHNFTLIHDDIEDGDRERRHRPTLWTIWGIPQAINTGDGMFALSRIALLDSLEQGVAPEVVLRLVATFDQAILTIAEGQYLDISFETRQDITEAMYIDMISRKTAALIRCSIEMGAILGTHDEHTIASLRDFGQAIGIAFQVRDDILGVWATSAELGKTEAGDVYRRKKSLPILHALEHAENQDQRTLHTIYQQTQPLNEAQVAEVLHIFERTHTRDHCRAFLAHHCQQARTKLASIPAPKHPLARQALNDMQTIVDFIEDVAHA